MIERHNGHVMLYIVQFRQVWCLCEHFRPDGVGKGDVEHFMIDFGKLECAEFKQCKK